MLFRRLDEKLEETPPAASCCGFCCCRRRIGLRSGVLWTCSLLVLEAVWHIVISFLRPLWEWNSTAVTIISFVLQDCARLLVLFAALMARSSIRNHTQPGTPQSASHDLVKGRLTILFKVICGLIFLELLELTVKWAEVQTVCEAPFVKQARMRRHPNMTSSELHAAEVRCEIISDVYDYVLELITIALLLYFSWIVHSYKRVITPTNSTVNYEVKVQVNNVGTQEVFVQGVIVDPDAAEAEDAA